MTESPAPAAPAHAHHAHGAFAAWAERVLGPNAELALAIGSGACWLAGLAVAWAYGGGADLGAAGLATGLYVAAMVLGGYFTFFSAGGDLLRGRLQIDFLMLVAAAGASALGKYGEGALLLFLFSLGHALEHYALRRARRSIAALSELAPAVALVRRGGELREVPIEELTVGEVIVVRPNSKIAADGVVALGSSAVNQAAITGESIPADKRASATWRDDASVDAVAPEHRVFAGTLNGAGAIEVKVLRAARDSTLSRLIALVREAEAQKSPTQHFAERFERVYVPAVLAAVCLLMLAFLVRDEAFGASFYRAMAVLIAASPCALAISTPSAVLAGIARAARGGVLVKGGRPLEALGAVRAVAFDKTGTLTEGRPRLTHVKPFGKTDEAELLAVAVAVESLSDHPLAAAIVEGARERLGPGVATPTADGMEALTARGVRAEIDGEPVHLGNRLLFEELTGEPVPRALDAAMTELEAGGHTAMIVRRARRYLGVVAVMDVARGEAAATLAALKRLGIARVVMLTGDNQRVAEAIGAEIGITDPMGGLLPEDKVRAVEALREREGAVAMVGDGVNDAPAMARATVGVAMGAAGSDVALETADVALMADRLDNLPFAIGLSRKANRVVRQNLWISLGMVALLVPLTLFDAIAIGPAVVGHEGSTVLVVLNALRLLRYDRAAGNAGPTRGAPDRPSQPAPPP